MDDGPSDAELVRRIGAKGADAAPAERTFCGRFGQRARLYGLRHLRDEARARDLMQSVLLAVLEALRAGRVEDPSRLDRFVLGTCRHVASRMRETDRRAEPVPDEVLASIVTEVVAAPEVVDLEALHRCLACLDDRAQKVIRMAFLYEQAAEEIAKTLSTTAGNVRVLRHRAVASLRQCLDAGRGAS
jgi:RNA polymerase sigma-70 factor, ECF subfamily